MMIDLHSHVLYDVDDGAKDVTMALAMCRQAVANGIHTLVATPHFMHPNFEGSLQEIVARHSSLKSALVKDKLDLQLLSGCEVRIRSDLVSFVKQEQIIPLNNSRYMLLELPHGRFPSYTVEVIYELQLAGYVPLIAHPERNRGFQKEPDLLFDLVSNGCLVQLTAGSLLGGYGQHAEDMAWYLVNSHCCHVLASDAHRPNQFASMPQAMDLLDAEQKEIIQEVSAAIVADKIVQVPVPVPFLEEPLSFMQRLRRVLRR